MFHAPSLTTDVAPPARGWTVAAVALGLLAAAEVVAMDISVGLGCGGNGFLRAVAGPRAWGGITVVVAALAGALLAYWWPRRRVARQYGVVVVAALVTCTAAAAFPAYLTVDDAGAGAWPAVASTLALFVGNVAGGFTAGGCGTMTPLAIQLASVTALATVFAAVGGIVVAFAGSSWDTVAARLSGRVVLVVDVVDDHGFRLVEVLARTLSPGTTLVVVERDPDSVYRDRLRRLGARVVLLTDGLSKEALSPFVVRAGGTGRAHKIAAAYLLSPLTSTNDRVAELVEQLCAAHPRGGVARLVVRVDDPLQAEERRRRPLDHRSELLTDTTGLFQVTAQEIVDRAVAGGCRQVMVVGATALTLAVLDELQQHVREVVAQNRDDGLDVIMLMSADGDALRDDHVRHQGRYGNDLVVPVELAPANAAVHPVVGDTSVLVVFTDPPSPESLMAAERVAARRPGAQVMVWVDGLEGVADRPVIDNLREFGLTLVATRRSPDGWRRSLPEDGWTRVARRLHERHIAGREVDDARPRSRDWDDLSDFYRESNLRQVWNSMRIAAEAGRTWVRPADGRAPLPLSADEIEAWAPVEHDSWRAYYERHGWQQGERQEAAGLPPRHDALLPWAELEEKYRTGTIEGIAGCFDFLAALGFTPFPKADAAEVERARWRRVARRGEVRAVRHDEAWTWTSEAGDTLQGAAGDWSVTDGASEWSITPADLADSYRHLGDDRYERTGAPLARPAVPGEVVVSQEGAVTALAGAWVLQDALGHRWVVPAERFAEAYEPY